MIDERPTDTHGQRQHRERDARQKFKRPKKIGRTQDIRTYVISSIKQIAIFIIYFYTLYL